MRSRLAVALLGSAIAVAHAAGEEAARVEAGRWCVTRGKIAALPDGRARIEDPKVRAVVPRSDGNEAEIRFDYDGPTVETARLGSGELRRQIGLKLRAENGCNVLYVMWRIEPRAELVVSVKRNPGMRTHRECGTRGYRNVSAWTGTPPAAVIAPGSHHALHAVLSGRTLRVWADKTLAWEGEVDVTAWRGPAGVRSDNGRFTVELRARPGGEGGPCGSSEGGDED